MSFTPLAMALLWLVGLSLAPIAVTAQEPLIVSAELRVRVAEESSGPRVAQVRLEYELQLSAGTSELPLRALAFAGATPERLGVRVNDLPVRLRLLPPEAGRINVVVALPPGTGPETRLRLDYQVTVPDTGAAYRMSVPLLVPAARPVGAPEGFFTAELRLPPDHAMLESFPVLPSRAAGEEEAIWNLRLQVVPAVLRWSARVGEPPLMRFGRFVDLAAVLVLLSGGAGAVRLLIRQQTEGP